MPGFDGTGPAGMGPMTGGGRGLCNPLSMGPMAGRGGAYGRGYGAPRRGRGGAWGGCSGGGWRHRNWYYATGVPGWARLGYPPAWAAPAPETYAPAADRRAEIDVLKQQAGWLKRELDAIGRRLDELRQEE